MCAFFHEILPSIKTCITSYLQNIMWPHTVILICDQIWENPPYGIYSENRVWCMVDKLYHRANSHSSPRLIARFTEELQCFVCDRATPPVIEKLQSKGIAMHTYGVWVYYAYTGSQLNGPGWSCSKWMQKIEWESNFALDIESCRFFDA